MAELHSILEIGVACIIDETSGVVVKLSHLHRLVKYLPTNVDLAIRCLIEIVQYDTLAGSGCLSSSPPDDSLSCGRDTPIFLGELGDCHNPQKKHAATRGPIRTVPKPLCPETLAVCISFFGDISSTATAVAHDTSAMPETITRENNTTTTSSPKFAKLRTSFLRTNVDMFLILKIASIVQHKTGKTALLWFDLPPGFGKTFAVEKFRGESHSANVRISTPTAFAASIYKESYARTYHHTYQVMTPGNRRYNERPIISEDFGDVKIKRRSHFIDEVSMCVKEHILGIIDKLRPGESLTFLGDEAQLLPIGTSVYFTDVLAAGMLANNKFAYSCHFVHSSDVVLPRLDFEKIRCAKDKLLMFAENDVTIEDVNSFKNHLLAIKGLIVNTPKGRYPTNQTTIDNCLFGIFDRFTISSTPFNNVISLALGTIMATCEDYNNHNKMDTATAANTRNIKTTTLVAYKNEVNDLVILKVLAHAKFKKSWLLGGCHGGDAADYLAPHPILIPSNAMTTAKIPMSDRGSVLEDILYNQPARLTKTQHTKFWRGMVLINKINRPDDKLINGDIFVLDDIVARWPLKLVSSETSTV